MWRKQKAVVWRSLLYRSNEQVLSFIKSRIKSKTNYFCFIKLKTVAHKNNCASIKEFNWNLTQIYFYFVCNQRTHILNVFKKGKNVTIYMSRLCALWFMKVFLWWTFLFPRIRWLWPQSFAVDLVIVLTVRWWSDVPLLLQFGCF